MTARFRCSIFFSLLLALSCSRPPGVETRKDSAPEAQGGAGSESMPEEGSGPSEAPGRLALAEVRGVRFVRVPAAQAEGVWLPAEAMSDESASVVIAAPVAGVIAELLTRPGARLAKGSRVLVLRSPELARLRSEWLGARARRAKADADLARERRLFQAEAGSGRELEAAESEAETAAAGEEAARLAIEARGLAPASVGSTVVLRAPKAGVVVTLGALLGESVEAGRELARLQAGAAALAKVELPPPAPAAWSPGAATEVRRSDGKRWPARVEGAPAVLSEDTRRLEFRLRLSGGDLPLPGTPLEARVVLAEAPILPQSAVQQVEGTWGVFVRDGDEAEFRPVRRGAELGGDVMILDGVRPGEIVAAEGAYLLKSQLLKQKSGGQEHEH